MMFWGVIPRSIVRYVTVLNALNDADIGAMLAGNATSGSMASCFAGTLLLVKTGGATHG